MVTLPHNPTPPGWGNDLLTQYLDTHRNNQLATFAKMPKQSNDLIFIDSLFVKLLDRAVNLKPLYPAFLLLRAHSAFRAACGAAMAGQVYEVNALLRLCLELAGYAHFIGDDNEKFMVWLSRQDSREAKQKVRDRFQFGKIRGEIDKASPDLSAIFAKLYEQTIDFGAHPNEMGFSLSSEIHRGADGGVDFKQIYLHAGDEAMEFAVKRTAEVGICALKVAQIIYPDRMQATGVAFGLEAIAKRYGNLL